MNVVELYNLAKWVNKEIEGVGLLNHYQELYGALRTQARRIKTPSEEQKNGLFKILKSIDFTSLTKDQEAFLDKLDISSAIGLHGIEDIESTLFRNQINPAIREQEFRRLINRLDLGISKMTEIAIVLKGYVRDEIGEYQDEVLIRVGFLGNASMSNVEDFKDWGEKWYFIGRGIAMAHGVSPQDIKIVGATRGSIILELLTDPEIAETVGRIILWSQEFIKNYLVIKKLMASAESSKLKNNPITETLAKQLAEFETHSEDDVNKIAESLIKGLKLKENVSGDAINELKKSIIILFDFNKQGGEVNLITHKQAEDSDKKDKLAEIRKIAKDIKVLEDETKSLEDQINRDNQKRLT